MSREFDELLSAYLDGEVSPEERAAVERRLEQSPALRETLDELSEVGDLIRKLPRARAPIDLPERVVAAIGSKPLASTTQPRRRLLGAWPLMAAGTVLAAGVAIVVLLPLQQENANRRLARSGDEAALAASPPARGLGLDADHDGGITPLSTPLATTWNDAEATQSLGDYVDNLGRTPISGETLSRLVTDNAGETHLVRFTVVDSRQVDNKIRTILMNNSFNVVETETAIPKAGVAAAPEATNGFLVYYVEGARQQVEQTLEEVGRAVDGQAEDFGPLAPQAEAARTERFAEPETRPASELELSLQKDKTDQLAPARAATPAPATAEFKFDTPALAPKPASSASGLPAPALVPADPAAPTDGLVDSKAREKAQLEDQIRLESRSGVAGKAVEQVPAQQGASRGEVERLSTTAPLQKGNAYRGVSAQLDSNSPIVETVRSRFAGNSILGNTVQVQDAFQGNAVQGHAVQGNAIQGNAVQGNAVQGNSLQRNYVAPSPNSFFRGRNQRGAEEIPSRKLTESVPAEPQEKLSEAKGAVLLKQQTPNTAGRSAADGTRDLAATVVNPQSAQDEDLVKVLLILEPQPPQPAAATTPAAPQTKPDAK